MLITLHDPNLACYYCDEVVLIQKGHLVSQGPTAAILTDRNLSLIMEIMFKRLDPPGHPGGSSNTIINPGG